MIFKQYQEAQSKQKYKGQKITQRPIRNRHIKMRFDKTNEKTIFFQKQNCKYILQMY